MRLADTWRLHQPIDAKHIHATLLQTTCKLVANRLNNIIYLNGWEQVCSFKETQTEYLGKVFAWSSFYIAAKPFT